MGLKERRGANGLDGAACRAALESRDPRYDGRFFVGVRSTGIYCRPVCPAPTPKPENTHFFPTAASASEAGFRPCLRCRPESAPGSSAWRGTSSTVDRALRLIERGELNDLSIDSFATRLGVGPRHLNRLFKRHLGVGPATVARTVRLHFALRLLRSTALPMGEVAAAAGFGSVRRFNSTISRTFGRTPSELRGARRVQRPRSEGFNLEFSYREPFDWTGLLGFLEHRAVTGLETVEGEVYRRTFVHRGVPGWLRVEKPDGKRSLGVTVFHEDPRCLLDVAARVENVFDLRASPESISDLLRQSEALKDVVKSNPGLRVPGGWSGFELAVRAILGQQITVRGAATLCGRIVESYGARLPGAPAGLEFTFPSAEALSEADLVELGVIRKRAETIRLLARAVAAGELDLDRAAVVDETLERLAAVPGIGPWTCQYIAMRALGDPDAFPSSDLVLLKAASGASKRASPKELEAQSQEWRPWRAYAALYLWRKAAELPKN